MNMPSVVHNGPLNAFYLHGRKAPVISTIDYKQLSKSNNLSFKNCEAKGTNNIDILPSIVNNPPLSCGNTIKSPPASPVKILQRVQQQHIATSARQREANFHCDSETGILREDVKCFTSTPETKSAVAGMVKINKQYVKSEEEFVKLCVKPFLAESPDKLEVSDNTDDSDEAQDESDESGNNSYIP